MGQVIGWDALLAERDQWRRQGKAVVWTNGCFDLFHAGHLRSLRQAAGWVTSWSWASTAMSRCAA